MATALRHVAAEGEVLPGPSLLWLQRHPPGAQSFTGATYPTARTARTARSQCFGKSWENMGI